MRIYLIKEFWDENWKEVLPVNNWYEGELTPTIYDPQTLQPSPPAYIIKCSDGKFRKADGDHFITQEVARKTIESNIIRIFVKSVFGWSRMN